LRWHWFGLAAIGCVAAVVGIQAGRHLGSSQQLGEAARLDELREGTELVFVYVGRASCSWCRRPEVVETVQEGFTAVRAYADRLGWHFTSIGVAIDPDHRRGLDHLRTVGDFDEIASGGGWGSSAAHDALWRWGKGPAGTPTVVVIARQRERVDLDGVPVLRVDNEALIAKFGGRSDLLTWQHRGYRLRDPTVVLERSAQREQAQN
jgi:hypothetical protein